MTTRNTDSINAASVLNVMGKAARPLLWRDLLAEFDLNSAHEKRNLRNVLRGLVRSQALLQDHSGAYQLPGQGSLQTGLLERRGKTLTFAGIPLESDRRSSLRAGDEVAARVDGDTVAVLEVIARSQAPLIGVVRTRGRARYVESLSRDYKGKISLTDEVSSFADGDTVTVQVIGEERRGLVGRIVDRIGRGGGVEQAVETMLANYEIPIEWPQAVAHQVERLPKQVHAGRHADRRSLVDLPLVTIDGETARDFDDAVYAEKRRGGWRLVVAIADVAQYVKSGSALDQTAWERGTSVYLPDRVIPMLPEALSNHLCSLQPAIPRLAMVCDMKISDKGQITGYEFYEAVIQSWERLTYTRVQEFLDTDALDVASQVRQSLSQLQALYGAFRAARGERGALDFESHEARLELRDGRVTAIHPIQRNEAHQLIEEAMIAANVSAARYLEAAERRALYRIHELPPAEKVSQIRQAFAFAGVRFPRGDFTPAVIQQALAQLAGRKDRWLFEMLVLRSLSQALYSPENKGHFGLALPRYMHFTSPIRRYADLVVHRSIKAVLHGRQPPVTLDQLLVTGEHISMAERRADDAVWGVEGWLKCEYVADRIGEVFDGIVMGVTDFGLFVELTGYYVQGLLHVSELGSDYFRYHEESMSLVGERSNHRFSLGDELQVVLVDVVPEQGRLDLRLNASRGQQPHPNKAKGKSSGLRRGQKPRRDTRRSRRRR
ncbi:MAG: ribonuclease R [Gammaproteobacteria bacterium]|nr:ribonuclease R [Gammaproteobacteria bacterium]